MKEKTMIKSIVGLVIALIVVVAIALIGINQSEESGIVKIGVVAPLTGEVADIGISAAEGIELAAREFNARGGTQIQIIAEDGKCEGASSASAANKLINIDGVNAILGGLCSGESMAIAPMAESNNVVMFSGCSSAPQLSDSGDYIFRSYPSDAYQGVFAAQYAYNTEGKRKAAIIYSNSDWGVGVQGSFAKEFKRLGGEIVVLETVDTESNDIRTQLTKAKSKDPDMLYTPMYPKNQGLTAKQAKELGMDILILGADGAKGSTTLEVAGSAAEGLQFTAVKELENQAFDSKLAANGISNMLCTPTAYDGANILFDIIEKVGDNSDAIKAELYKVANYNGVSGTFSIDENGDRIGAEYSVFEVQDGEFATIA